MLFKRTAYILSRIICAAIVCAFIFCSCQSNSVDDYPFISLDSDMEKEMTHISIIVPDDVSPTLMQEANTLSNAIKSKISVETSIYHESKDPPKNSYTVLLGALDDDRSAPRIKLLRSNDYICEENNGVLVLGGKNDTSTVKAIKKFTDEILPVSTRYALIPNMGGFTYRENYKIEKYTLNGTELGNYIIVTDTSVDDTRSYALSMQKIISDKTGYWLNIKNPRDTESYWNTIQLQIIKDNFENGICRITPTEKGFVISAKDKSGIDTGIKKLTSLLVSDIDNSIVDKSISREISLAYSNVTASIFSYTHDAKTALSAQSTANILSPIWNAPPDLLLFSKLDSLSGKIFSENLTSFEQIKTNENIYTYSNYACAPVYYKENDGITIEGYKIDNDELTLAIVKINGCANKETQISLPSSIIDLSLPTVVIIHTIGGEKVSIIDPSSSYITQVFDKSEKYFTENIRFTCYASIDCIDITISDIKTAPNVQCLTITGKVSEI